MRSRLVALIPCLISLILGACSDKTGTTGPLGLSSNSALPSETPTPMRQAAAPIEWDGGGNDGLWSNPLNWVGDQVPAAGDSVIIEDAGTVHVDIDATVSRFRFGTADPSSNPVADELIVDAGVEFTVLDDPSDNRLTISFHETVTIEGTLVIADAAIFGAGTHTNNGTIRVLGPVVRGGALTQTGGPYAPGGQYFGSTFTNNGTLEVAGRAEFGATSQNGAGVTVNNGDIALQDGKVAWKGQSETVFGDDVSAKYDFHNSAAGEISGTGYLILGSSQASPRWQVPFRNDGTIDLASGSIQTWTISNRTVIENAGSIEGTGGELQNHGSLLNACGGTVSVTVTENALVQLPCNDPPVVDAGTDQVVEEGAQVTLAGAGATFADPDSPPHSATVDWGDGTAASLGTVTPGALSGSHVYTDDGTFQVEICVTDSEPATGCDSFEVTVTNVPPSVTVNDRSITEGGTVAGTVGSFSDAGSGDTHTATVDWGEGGPAEAVNVTASGNVNASHTYAEDGTYALTLCVQDDDGAETCASATVTVTNVPPTVSVDDQSITEGEAVSGTIASFTDPGSEDTHTATVDWGEGGGPEPATVSGGDVSGAHTYAEDGSFTLTVCVEDDDGAETCRAVTVTVDNATPIVSAGDPIGGDEGSTVALVRAAFTDAGVQDVHTATIDWGDGPTEPATVTEANGSGSVSATHVYADDGTYDVTVCVIDDEGAVACDSAIATIANVAPAVLLSRPIPVELVRAGNYVGLEGRFTDPGADSHSAVWRLASDITTLEVPEEIVPQPGGGLISTWVRVDTPGLYRVTLSVHDDDGGTGSASAVNGVETLVVVFDPAAGSVEGAGGFDSPAGAYVPDPGFAGRARVTIQVRYPDEGVTPTGWVTVSFEDRDLDLRSTALDWLVILPGGSVAIIGGTGIFVGRDTEYRFQVWLEDLDFDEIRVRVWRGHPAGAGDVIYDAGAPQALVDGDFIIHGH